MKLVTVPILKADLEIISGLTIDDLPAGYVLEPGPQHPFAKNKVPVGTWPLDLVWSKEFSLLKQYTDIFKESNGNHLMIEINFAPDTHRYIHIGNKWQDTQGCNLCGLSYDKSINQVLKSTDCYKKIYLAIHDAILGDGATIEVMD
jgi:hypothetical protein